MKQPIERNTVLERPSLAVSANLILRRNKEKMNPLTSYRKTREIDYLLSVKPTTLKSYTPQLFEFYSCSTDRGRA